MQKTVSIGQPAQWSRDLERVREALKEIRYGTGR